MALCLPKSSTIMLQKFSTRLLGHLGHEIELGRPLWALLIANEYRSEIPYVWEALVTKAIRAISENQSYRVLNEIVALVTAGATLSELPAEMQVRVREFREIRTPTKKRFLFSFQPTKSAGLKRITMFRRNYSSPMPSSLRSSRIRS